MNKTPKLFAAAAVLALALALVPATAANANNTTYYINNSSGSGCSDAGSGTSPSQPWCTFTPANGLGALGPGDRVLLARGATWNQQLTLTGSGSSSSLVELGAYGSGARPIITRNSQDTDRAVRINNASHWIIRDLELKNAAAGLLMYYDTKNHSNITIDNLYVNGISGIHQGNYSGTDQLGAADGIWNSYGIGFTGVVPATMASNESMVSNVVISDIEGTNNQSSVALDWFNGENRVPGSIGFNNMRNVLFNNLYLHDDDGAGRSDGCDEGMRIVGATDVVMMNSRLINEAACYSRTGTAAMLVGRLKNATFQNNVFSDVANTGSFDQVAIDYEHLEENVVFKNNVFANNAGSGISYLNIYPTDVNSGAVSTGNTFIDNGQASHRQAGGAGIYPTGTISDNLYYEPNRFLISGGNFNGFAISNNQALSSPSDASPASTQFSTAQGSNNWSYQYLNGSTWTNLSHYESSTQVWQLSSTVNVPQVGRFALHPGVGSSTTVARTWTAPRAGLVTIRGLVFKESAVAGDGVSASILHNGTRVWPVTAPQAVAFNDQVGHDSEVDQLLVAAGDTIRFVVTPGSNNADDLTGWAPTVAYTAGWEFATANDAQGWSAANDVSLSVGGGALAITNTGNDPYLASPAMALEAATMKKVEVRLSNATTATTAEIFFGTAASPGWSASRSVVVPVSPQSGLTTYLVDMSSNSAWVGTITGLRLDPPGTSGGSSAVDWIRIRK